MTQDSAISESLVLYFSIVLTEVTGPVWAFHVLLSNPVGVKYDIVMSIWQMLTISVKLSYVIQGQISHQNILHDSHHDLQFIFVMLNGLTNLIPLPLDKMAAISQAISSDAFFFYEKFCISIKIWLKFVPKGPIDNNPALV